MKKIVFLIISYFVGKRNNSLRARMINLSSANSDFLSRCIIFSHIFPSFEKDMTCFCYKHPTYSEKYNYYRSNKYFCSGKTFISQYISLCWRWEWFFSDQSFWSDPQKWDVWVNKYYFPGEIQFFLHENWDRVGENGFEVFK